MKSDKTNNLGKYINLDFGYLKELSTIDMHLRFYTKIIVSENVYHHRICELRELFFIRMVKRKEYFFNNDLIQSNYDFSIKVINGLL